MLNCRFPCSQDPGGDAGLRSGDVKSTYHDHLIHQCVCICLMMMMMMMMMMMDDNDGQPLD